MKKAYFFIIIILSSFMNLYSQVSIWKFNGSTTASGVGDNVGRTVSVFGGTGVINSGNTWWGPVQYIYVCANNWGGGSMTKGFKLQVKTRLYQTLRISYAHGSDDFNGTNIGPQDFKLQYSLDDATYTDVPGGSETIVGGNIFENCVTVTNLSLPAACNDQNAVYLRWIMTSNSGVKGKTITAVGNSSLANIDIQGIEIPMAPTDITLSNNTLNAGVASGTTVGNLTQTDANSSGTYTFSLVAGTGSEDNGSFTISGNVLKTNGVLGVRTYHIRINVNDGTFDFAKEFTVTVQSLPPTDITLSENYLAHGPALGTTVGTLTATDPDPGDTHTFTLVAGDGDTDNGKFTISGNELKTNASLADNIYSIRINANDGINDFAKVFLVAVGYGIFTFNYPDVSYITNVTLNTINNTSGYLNYGLSNYSGVTTTLAKNSTYSLSVTIGPAEVMGWEVNNDLKIRAYFDWNQNLSFNDDGEMYDVATSMPTLTGSMDITVPSTASSGTVRCRIIYWYDGTSGGLMPPSTGSADYGEAEDYNITITDPLPVELTSFNAKLDNKYVVLKWQTATELNNYGFEIERILLGTKLGKNSWEKIGFVEGNGNSNSPKEYSFTDVNPIQGKAQYRLKQIDLDGNYKYYSQTAEINYSLTDIKEKQLPTEFALKQNYPNPFNPGTVITYQLPVTSNVLLKVYNILGKEIATLVNEEKQPGYYRIEFDASKYNLSNGTYFYRLTAGEFISSKKFTLLK